MSSLKGTSSTSGKVVVSTAKGRSTFGGKGKKSSPPTSATASTSDKNVLRNVSTKGGKDTSTASRGDTTASRGGGKDTSQKDKEEESDNTPHVITNLSKYKDDTSRYAILTETSAEEHETWYNFIKYEGNEEALSQLAKDLDKAESYVLDEETSCFDMDINHLVTAQCAKEMSKVELNAVTFHRKFDGKMKSINFNFRKRDSQEDMILKIHRKLGNRKLERYIDEEDIDSEDEICEDTEGGEEGSEAERESDEGVEGEEEVEDDHED